jgi:hypothetical protein
MDLQLNFPETERRKNVLLANQKGRAEIPVPNLLLPFAHSLSFSPFFSTIIFPQ